MRFSAVTLALTCTIAFAVEARAAVDVPALLRPCATAVRASGV